MVQALSRRDRLRAATVHEIKETARRLLVSQGTDAVTLRAIAREMGMTAPGLYRYFSSHEELIKHVIADIFTELTDDLDAAVAAAGAAAAGKEIVAGLTDKMVAACRAFRRWSLAHKEEYGLLFGSPLPGLCDEPDEILDKGGTRFAGVFFALFLELWQRNPFPVPAPGEIDPGLRGQLEQFLEAITTGLPGALLPAGAGLTFLRCWTRLYGAVTLEVFGHLRFALDDPGPMFEYTLSEMAEALGLSYPY
ncbi:MAG TPA: TetR/AcrR family transcriptional regulator [Streptosporangiaceae bacterium]|nr:TetR/AcrR family transcriptional regulator [Streptosporangiaceae bacterium]